MKMVKVEASGCPQNHYCPVLRECPFGAISQKDPFSVPEIDEQKCTGCAKCTNYCRVFRMI